MTITMIKIENLIEYVNNPRKNEAAVDPVASSIKELKKYAPCVDLIVSYADIDQGHKGIIYQATNWIYAGIVMEGKRSNYVVNGKKIHPRSIPSKNWKSSLSWIREHVDKDAIQEVTKGRHKYLYPLNKKMRKKIKALAEPYPGSVIVPNRPEKRSEESD